MLPTATVLATRMESQWKRIQIYAPDADAEARIGTTFVLDQLLKLALFCDYSDEAGRRKMMDGFMGRSLCFYALFIWSQRSQNLVQTCKINAKAEFEP